MSNQIETNPIAGFQVYGVQMVEYTSEGISGRDYGTATAIASFANATAIEKETSAYAEVLRARQKKLTDLSDAMAIIAECIARLPTKKPKSDDMVASDSLPRAKSLMERYGLSLTVTEIPMPSAGTVYLARRDDLENARANVEYAMDMENNDMQQDMITLQGLISKRDNSYSTASKILKKYNDTGKSMVNNVGQ